jgi:beta-lactamase superfamily II metal-dependent hydrolase
MKDEIKYYPVGNGDQSLIKLKDNTTILVDCNIRQGEEDSNGIKIYDVKADLLESLQTRNGNPYLDVFILSHGDQDHCRGFSDNFYRGDPTKYSDKNKKNKEIIIDEMWFSPMIAEKYSNNDEDAHQKEAERRIELHKNNDSLRNLPGNRIRIIGYDGNKDYTSLNHLRYLPGDVVGIFNDKAKSEFSIFIHAPFNEQLTDSEKDKNYTSIVFQARFKNNSWDNEFTCLALFGGDADHHAWAMILEKTRKYKNDINQYALAWDLFLAPHHCSWTFFNDTPQHENTEPKKTSLAILDYKRNNGKVISSSKKIINNDDNPPHYEAKQEYLKKLNKSTEFLNTALEPTEKEPEPITFEIVNGLIQRAKTKKERNEERLAAAIAVTSSSIIKKPWCY